MAQKKNDKDKSQYWRGYPAKLSAAQERKSQNMSISEDDSFEFRQEPESASQQLHGDTGSRSYSSARYVQNDVASASSASHASASSAQQTGRSQTHQASFEGVAAKSRYSCNKNHVVAGLLAIFLGMLGIHKFYLGYNSVGFIMLAVTILGSLLSFGLAGLAMAVIGIIEGIIYLAAGQKGFERTYIYNMKQWF